MYWTITVKPCFLARQSHPVKSLDVRSPTLHGLETQHEMSKCIVDDVKTLTGDFACPVVWKKHCNSWQFLDIKISSEKLLANPQSRPKTPSDHSCGCLGMLAKYWCKHAASKHVDAKKGKLNRRHRLTYSPCTQVLLVNEGLISPKERKPYRKFKPWNHGKMYANRAKCFNKIAPKDFSCKTGCRWCSWHKIITDCCV